MVGYIFVLPICLGAVAITYRKVFPEQPPTATAFGTATEL
jgi:hypothetical protein